MRRRLIAMAAAAAVVTGACASSASSDRAAAALPSRSVTVGALEVTITPERIDASGATFTIAFDTHTGAPGIDVAKSAALDVGGRAWTGAAWSGDGPGGHHRKGVLRFSAAGPVTGAARLTISGLDRPVVATWPMSGEGTR